MKLILLGPPGSGKGTQAVRITQKYRVPHISTGDIFRSHIRRESALGLEVKNYLDQGLLVPDEVTVRIVENRLTEPDCQDGFLLDGFPRTLMQAKALDEGLQKLGKALTAVINLEVRNDTVIKRMAGRQICSGCGETYNLYFNKPQTEGICDKCNRALYTRSDDTEETIANRLRAYAGQTAPLIGYYSRKGLLVPVNGEQSADEVFNSVSGALKLGFL